MIYCALIQRVYDQNLSKAIKMVNIKKINKKHADFISHQ